MQVTISRLTAFDSKLFNDVMDIYKNSIPLYEQYSEIQIKNRLSMDPNYNLLIARLYDNTVIGFSLLYFFKSLKIGFLDYIAVDKKYRNYGIGTKLFDFTFNYLCNIMVETIGLIFEVQKPSLDHLIEEKHRVKRINFYLNRGSKILENIHYLFPLPDHKTTETMYLMIKPVNNINFLSKEFVMNFIKSLYFSFYDYSAGKSALNTIFENTRSIIRLV